MLTGPGFGYDVTERDIDYEFDVDFRSTGMLLDWHPFIGTLLREWGVYNGKELDAEAKMQRELENEDTIYTSDEIGIRDGDVDFSDFALYLGIGWYSTIGKVHRGGILVDVCALYLGTSNVT